MVTSERNPDIDTLLSVLKTLPDLAATRNEWRIRSGSAYPVIERLLEPTGDVAGCMPCVAGGLGLHYHDVHEFSDGSRKAVYTHEVYECPSFDVERWERAVLRPDVDALGRMVCEALRIERLETVSPLLDRSFEIGSYHPLEAYKFPVVLSLHHGAAASEQALLLSTAVCSTPFIFLTAYPWRIRGRLEGILASRHIVIADLSEMLVLTDDHQLAATHEWERIISRFRRKVVPESEPVMAFFETPPNTRWGEVTIRFRDGYTALVEAAGVKGRFSYTEMGMANRRESRPSKQWMFLEEIAVHHGAIHFDMGDPSKNKSWRHALSSDLRAFFRIADDPFIYDEDTKCWQAKFSVSS